jgi:hypothetical protein
MKDIEMNPKKIPFVYFLIVALLIFHHTYVLQHDMKAWFLGNFYISGMLLIYCLAKGLNIFKGEM